MSRPELSCHCQTRTQGERQKTNLGREWEESPFIQALLFLLLEARTKENYNAVLVQRSTFLFICGSCCSYIFLLVFAATEFHWTTHGYAKGEVGSKISSILQPLQLWCQRQLKFWVFLFFGFSLGSQTISNFFLTSSSNNIKQKEEKQWRKTLMQNEATFI